MKEALSMLLWLPESNSFQRASRQFEVATGWKAEELAASPLLHWIHPEDQAGLQKCIAVGNGCVQARHRTHSGDWIPVEWAVKNSPDGIAVLGNTWKQGAIGPIATAPNPAAPGTSLAQTLEAAVHVVEANNPDLRCSILLTDPQHEFVTVGAGPSLPAEYNDAVEGLRIGPSVGACGTAAFWNTIVVVEDIAKDPLWKDLRGAAALAGVSACWSCPITSTEGLVLGAIALYSEVPSAPSESQLGGLEIAARMVGLAIEHHRLEEQVLQAAKLEALGVLTGGIAHDFNNMLAVVLGNAELAECVLPSDSAARPMLRRIVAASVGATDFCNQMLAYAGRGALSNEVFEFNDLVAEIGDLLRVSLSKKARLDFDLDFGPMFVSADSSQLRQVVMNLITNAAEAVGDQEGQVLVSTRIRHLPLESVGAPTWGTELDPGDYLCLSVIDSGIGMSPELQAKIFDPFFTTKTTGRGLGLAAVRGIVSSHKGAIDVMSRLGSGTTFSVVLPIVAAPQEKFAAPPPGQSTPIGRRVLLVEDDPMVHQLMNMMLEGAGYSVLGAWDGQSAVNLYRAQSESIDLVLLDLSMPKLDGEEVYRELIKVRPDVRVVLSSGFTEQEIKARFRGLDLAGIVQKPTQMRTLLAKVAKALA